MPKILLGVSILLIAATAFFGVSTKTKVSGLNQTILAKGEELKKSQDSEKKAKADMKTAQDAAAEAKTAADKAIADAKTAADNLQKAQDESKGLKDQVDSKDKEIADLKAKAQGMQPGQAPQPAEDVAKLKADLDQTKTQLAEQTTINKGLADKLASAEEKTKVYQDKEKKREGQLMAKGLEGQVLAVNPGWNFVVMSIGDRQGVVMGAEMIVVRGNYRIAKLKISSVEPSTSIADIEPGSLAKGMRVQPGDKVIYPGAGI